MNQYEAAMNQYEAAAIQEGFAMQQLGSNGLGSSNATPQTNPEYYPPTDAAYDAPVQGRDAGHIARSVNGLGAVNSKLMQVACVFEAELDRLMGGHPLEKSEDTPQAGLAPRQSDFDALDVVVKQMFARAEHLAQLVNRLCKL